LAVGTAVAVLGLGQTSDRVVGRMAIALPHHIAAARTISLTVMLVVMEETEPLMRILMPNHQVQ
jgi:hypothetical protein